MKKKLLLLLGVLAVLAAAFGVWKFTTDKAYRESHVFIEEAVYPADAQNLDLRGTGISRSHYEQLKAALPDCGILWDVPFQGGLLSSDVEAVTVTSLTAEDVSQLLTDFPKLRRIHAEGCKDYALLEQLRAEKPQWEISCQVELGGIAYSPDTKALTLTGCGGEELLEKLAYLPKLETVTFPEPKLEGEELKALVKAYPGVSFVWEKSVLGQVYPNTVTELDFSGRDVGDLEALEKELAYFPDLEKVLLCGCGLENEALAAFRDRVREDYKVVWTISVGMLKIRTDETTFMPSRDGQYVNDSHLTELKYCEDMIVVDVGHKGVKNIDWVYNMPHLQFLILADTDVCDITPVGTLKELIYLEIFKCPDIKDYTPLLNCKALQDLNLAYTSGDVSVLAEMTWLKSLWANCCNATKEQKQLLRDSLPDTLLELDHGWHMGNGWRNRENYYVMRDLLGMPYYDWGSERLEALGN